MHHGETTRKHLGAATQLYQGREAQGVVMVLQRRGGHKRSQRLNLAMERKLPKSLFSTTQNMHSFEIPLDQNQA